MRLKLIKGLNCQKNKQAKKKTVLLYNYSVLSLFVEHFKMDPIISYIHKSSDLEGVANAHGLQKQFIPVWCQHQKNHCLKWN